jgi:hypothetical protein
MPGPDVRKLFLMMALGMIFSSLFGCAGSGQSHSDPSHTAVQEPLPAGKYETREIYVDRDGMNIYGVAHIPSGVEGKSPAVILSHELGATLDRVKGYGEALAEAGYVTVCFDFCGGGWASRGGRCAGYVSPDGKSGSGGCPG